VEQVKAAKAPVRIRPWASDYQLQLTGVAADGLTAVHVRNPTGSLLEHLDGDDGYAVVLPVSGALEIATSKGEVVATEKQMSVSDTREHRRSRYAPDTELYCLFVERAALDEALAPRFGQPPSGRIRFVTALPQSDGVQTLLTALIDTALRGVQGDAALSRLPLTWHNLKQTMLACLLEGVPHNGALPRRHNDARVLPRQVRRAIEFMNANAHRAISITEIAAYAATSPRSLQTGFRQFHGMTPTEYLRDLRLKQVQAELLDPTKPSSIAEIATAWGFVHLGLFAARYREAFGELPKATLSRRR
jgi:AraC-like DNA-binding protein